MGTSWYGKFFAREAKVDLTSARAKADEGDAEAQFALGLRYDAADGDTQDLAEAARWYHQAAEQNHSVAQFNLGLMYARGAGVPRDDAEALRWFRKAAQQGDAGAQFNLGLRYHRASVWGPKLDALEPKIEAYKWLRLAVAQGYKGSLEAWERVAITMTRDEVSAGNHDAAAFVAGKPVASKTQ